MSKSCIHVLCFLFLLTACSPMQSTTPIPGKYIDVGDHQMYLYCSGNGAPSVILEAGYNDNSETWALVQPAVAEFARVCVYDRAGLGWSDPGPEPRDGYQTIGELHTLLTAAGEKGPFVLAGHSLGGLYMRLYADQYPEEVVGLVLVDSAHVDDAERCKKVLPPETQYESESLKTIREYLANPLTFTEIPERILEPGSLGDLPLVVLSVPKQQRPEDLPASLRDAMDEIWVDLQNEWAMISTNSSHVFVAESSHFIQKDQPDVVIAAIQKVVEMARLDQ